jgi:hypothetical protein
MATTLKKTTAKKTASPAKPAKPTKPAKPKVAVKVFQLLDDAKQAARVDNVFEVFDYSQGLENEWREWAVFEALLASPRTKGVALWGADLLKQVAANPGHDVYFCNPYLSNEALYHNTWMQGETEFPKFLAVVQSVFRAAGLDEAQLWSVHPSSSYSRGNCFVATPKFWKEFLTFVREVFAAAESKLPANVLKALHSKVPDPRGVYMGASYVPFIAERLFGYFMHQYGKGFKAHKLSLPKCEAELNVHQKLLREMKDVAHQTKSAWMAACWVNYRNLYVTQNNSKAWCEKYLRTLTPAKIRFV